MSGVERLRESVSPELAQETIRDRMGAGWRLVGLEWERDSTLGTESHLEPVPYGLRVAPDCCHLEADPAEFEVLTQVAQMIVQESCLPRIADALNRKGHRMRNGENWTSAGVFELMPRLIDSSPRIFSAVDWPMRRRVTSTVSPHS
jgi:hypothetical protein